MRFRAETLRHVNLRYFGGPRVYVCIYIYIFLERERETAKLRSFTSVQTLRARTHTRTQLGHAQLLVAGDVVALCMAGVELSRHRHSLRAAGVTLSWHWLPASAWLVAGDAQRHFDSEVWPLTTSTSVLQGRRSDF